MKHTNEFYSQKAKGLLRRAQICYNSGDINVEAHRIILKDINILLYEFNPQHPICKEFLDISPLDHGYNTLSENLAKGYYVVDFLLRFLSFLEDYDKK